MNNFLKSKLAVALSISLMACGGGGGGSSSDDSPSDPVVEVPETPETPISSNMINISSFDLADAESLVTGSQTVSANSYRGSVQATATVDNQAVFKMLADGSFESIEITDDGNETVTDSVQIVDSFNIGGGWSVLTVQIEDVRMLNLNSQDKINFDTVWANMLNTYIVNNATGKSYLVNDLGTPAFKFAGQDALFVDSLRDTFVSATLDEDDIEQTKNSIEFDENGDVYFIAQTIDTLGFDETFTVTTERQLVKLHLSELTDSSDLQVSHFDIPQGDSFSVETYKLSNDGAYVLYLDSGSLIAQNLSTGATTILRNDVDEVLFPLFKAFNGDMYALDAITSDIKGQVLYKVVFGADQVELSQVYDTGVLANSADYVGITSLSDTFALNGKTLISSSGYYEVFDSVTEKFTDSALLLDAQFTTAKRKSYNGSLYVLGWENLDTNTGDFDNSKLVKWTPSNVGSTSDSVVEIDIDPETFKVRDFSVYFSSSFVVFSAELKQSYNGIEAGSIVVGLKNATTNSAPLVFNTFSNVESVESVSKDTITVDGSDYDWKDIALELEDAEKDVSSFGNEINDADTYSNIGDIKSLAFTDNDEKLWLSVTSYDFSTFNDTVTEIVLADNIKLLVDTTYTQLIDNGSVIDLTSVGGETSYGSNFIEVAIPKSALTSTDYDFAVNTYSSSVKGKGEVAYNFLNDSDEVEMLVSLGELNDGQTVQIEIYDSYIINVENDSGSYVVEFQSDSLTMLDSYYDVIVTDGYVSVEFNIPVTAVGSHYNDRVKAKVVSQPLIELSELIDSSI